MLISRADMAGAEELVREALAIQRNLLPAGDPKLAVTLSNLGFIQWRKGSLEEAEALYTEALNIDRRALGNDHPEIPIKLLNLAVLMRDRGRPEAAETFAREALAIRRKILGDEHPDLSDAMDVVAAALEQRGRNAEAEPILREALAIALKAYGEVNLNTARLRHNLGWVLWKEGAYAEAEPLLRVAVTNIPKTYGAAYRGNRLAVSNLAHNLNGLGDVRAAETTARRALSLYREAPTDRMVVTALIALSHALMAQRRGDEAAPLLQEALASVEQHPQIRYPWFKGEIQSSLGAVLAAQTKLDDAERLLVAGYEGLRDTPSAPPPRIRAALERLVSFYAATGRSGRSRRVANPIAGIRLGAAQPPLSLTG